MPSANLFLKKDNNVTLRKRFSSESVCLEYELICKNKSS